MVSSAQLASRCAVNAVQVRKDLSYFGEFGFRGVGYYVEDLLSDIKRILGLNKERRLAIIGIGNLGSSLLGYKDFLKQNYKIVAAFDIDPPKVIERVGRSTKLCKASQVNKTTYSMKSLWETGVSQFFILGYLSRFFPHGKWTLTVYPHRKNF